MSYFSTPDPDHITYMIHLRVESLRAAFRNEPGWNYIDRLRNAVANDARVSPDSLAARDLASDAKTLRGIADDLDLLRKQLTSPLSPFRQAAE